MFYSAVNCMDGRVQEPVIAYLKNRFNIKFVDMITEPGPNKILAEKSNDTLINSILDRLDISVKKHQSQGIAVIGHHDCAGNPTDDSIQKNQVIDSVAFLKEIYDDVPVIGLWVDKTWQVQEVI